MKKQRMMAVFAHPDDEGQIAGTMAKYAARGVEVFLVCATRGELGSVNDSLLQVGGTIAKLREKELRCVCRVLGVERLRFLGFREGSFHTVDSNRVIDKLLEVIQEFNPQIIITFGPEGVYGHRDHLAINRWVTSAFYTTRQRCAFCGLKGPSKLYYTAYPRSLFDGLRRQGLEFKIDIEGNMRRIEGVPDERITTIIDVAAFQSQKIQAFGCHRSQLRPGDFRWMIMQGELVGLLVTERLVRVFPPSDGSREIEKDLFPVMKG
jgi:LmbE family N-acetylglucosaminyl deacetylase